MALQAETWGVTTKLSLFCTDPEVYKNLPTFPEELHLGLTLAEPNKFFLPFNAALHLLHSSDLLDTLKAAFPTKQDVLNYYFTTDLQKTLDILFAAPLENAHAHGNRFDPQKVVTLAATFKEEGENLVLQIEVEDEGDGFDWKHALDAFKKAERSYHHHPGNPNPHYKEKFPKAEGTALYALFSMCDEVTFNEKGNVIKLQKILSI